MQGTYACFLNGTCFYNIFYFSPAKLFSYYIFFFERKQLRSNRCIMRLSSYVAPIAIQPRASEQNEFVLLVSSIYHAIYRALN